MVAFIVLAETKGNILNKQWMGNGSMQNMLEATTCDPLYSYRY